MSKFNSMQLEEVDNGYRCIFYDFKGHRMYRTKDIRKELVFQKTDNGRADLILFILQEIVEFDEQITINLGDAEMGIIIEHPGKQ